MKSHVIALAVALALLLTAAIALLATREKRSALDRHRDPPVAAVEGEEVPAIARARMGEPLVVNGLAAGAFEVTLWREPFGELLATQRVELDGKNDVPIEMEIP